MGYGKELKYSLYTVFHPFKGFWEIKYEGRGSLRASMTFLALCVLSQILRGQLTGYMFNEYYPESVNALLVTAQVLALFFLWCLANWCLTTLMEGEGSLHHIMVAVGYCLPPVILANVVNCILSNLISQDEEAFLHYIDGMALLWFGFLLLAATVVVQQYSLMKTVGTSILTVCVMLIFVFIGLLCVSLVQQVVSFVNSVYSEIVYRV